MVIKQGLLLSHLHFSAPIICQCVTFFILFFVLKKEIILFSKIPIFNNQITIVVSTRSVIRRVGLARFNVSHRDGEKFVKDEATKAQLRRANAAMANGAEAMTLYGPAVVLAISTGN